MELPTMTSLCKSRRRRKGLRERSSWLSGYSAALAEITRVLRDSAVRASRGSKTNMAVGVDASTQTDELLNVPTEAPRASPTKQEKSVPTKQETSVPTKEQETVTDTKPRDRTKTPVKYRRSPLKSNYSAQKDATRFNQTTSVSSNNYWHGRSSNFPISDDQRDFRNHMEYFNNGQMTDRYSFCQAPERIFCYRCGEPGITFEECSRCYWQWKLEGSFRP